MPTLALTKNYADSTLLLADDFDVFLDELEVLLNTTKLDDTNIQDNGITGSDKILTASIPTSKILNANITTATLDDEIITTAKIAATNITTAKLADGAVTAAKIANSAVTTAKIANSNITKAKIRSTNYSKSAATSGSITSATSSIVGSATITTSGRPVMIFLESGSSTVDGYVYVLNQDSGYTPAAPNLTESSLGCIFYRGASIISAQEFKPGWIPSLKASIFDPVFSTPGFMRLPPGSFTYIEQPAAGTYTYSVYLDNNNTNRTVAWESVKVVVVEL